MKKVAEILYGADIKDAFQLDDMLRKSKTVNKLVYLCDYPTTVAQKAQWQKTGYLLEMGYIVEI
jgi:hypothetical protein